MASRTHAPLLALLAGAVFTLPVSAQNDSTRFQRLWSADYDGPRRLEISAGAGYSMSTDWSDLVALQLLTPGGGVTQQVLLRNVSVAPGAGVGGAVTYWRGRHAFRVSGGYSRSCLTTASRCVDGPITAPPPQGAALAVAEVPMDIWRYGVEGLVGLRSWTDSRVWRPYMIVGGGGVTYDPAANALPFFPGTFQSVVPQPTAPGSVVISDGTSSFLVATSELGLEHVFGLTVGMGMDFRVPLGIGGAALRLEVVDQITSSPFSVSVARLDAGGWRGDHGIDEITYRRGAVHNLRVSAGVALELGLSGPRTETDPWAATRGR